MRVVHSMPVVSIKWVPKATRAGGHLELLDQTKLPLETHWITCRHAAEVIDAIKRLAVRGAPAIGIAGAYAYCLAAQHVIDSSSCSDGTISDGRALCDGIAAHSPLIAAARPTAVNLQWAVSRMDRVITKYRCAFANQLCVVFIRICSLKPSVTWAKDEDAFACSVSTCCKSFTLLERKHHCRLCGLVVCNACTKVVKVFVNGPEPIRCCSACMASGRHSAGPTEMLLALCREVLPALTLMTSPHVKRSAAGAKHSPGRRAPLPPHQPHRRANHTRNW